MDWRAAHCLLTLRGQVDALWPGRDRASDGLIGDAAHQGEVSDHNPDAYGIVRALDLTHDPAGGCDIDRLSDALAAGRDPRISYVIANRLIMSGPDGPSPWVWRAYGGSDPHTNHIHISVVADTIADSTAPWALPGLEDDMTKDEARLLANVERILTCWADGRQPFGIDYGNGQALKTLPNPIATLAAKVDTLPKTATTAPVALTEQDRQAIITQISAQVTAQVEVTIRRVLGSLDQASGQ